MPAIASKTNQEYVSLAHLVLPLHEDHSRNKYPIQSKIEMFGNQGEIYEAYELSNACPTTSKVYKCAV